MSNSPFRVDDLVAANTITVGTVSITASDGNLVLPANTTVAGQSLTGATGPAGTPGTPGTNGTDGATGATGATGIQGNVGITGATGTAGTNGIDGATGATGATGLGFTWRGTWSNFVSYYINDVVYFGGASYVALTLHTASQPPSANWAVLSSQGDIGATGATGASGTPGTAGTPGTNGADGATGATGVVTNSETVGVKTSATGTVVHDYAISNLFYHSGIAANFTANFTNVPTTNDRSNSVSLILVQGATPYICSAVQIDGAAQTIKWLNGSQPTGTANRTEVQSFSFVRTGSSWTVFGSLLSYG
jgi:hypothetical protein